MRRVRATYLLLATLLVAACSAQPAATTSPSPTIAQTPRTPDEPHATPPRPSPTAAQSFTPGTVQYRVVNLRPDETLDIDVQTDGVIQAIPVQAGLAHGEATDYFAPPAGGAVVVRSGPEVVATASTGFGEGDARTLIVYEDGALELWHDPDPASVGTTGNALAPADPSTALLYVVGVALSDADFGLRLAFDGLPGCQPNRTSESILVGGNQIAVFAFAEVAGVQLYDPTDTECAGPPVGGPFPVSGDAGSRTLLVLYGEPTAMEALDLEL